MTKLDNFDRAKVGYDKMDAHDADIWNAAIEAAAKQAAHCIGIETLLATHTSMEVRKLKK